jgi:hypothetical protein
MTEIKSSAEKATPKEWNRAASLQCIEANINHPGDQSRNEIISNIMAHISAVVADERRAAYEEGRQSMYEDVYTKDVIADERRRAAVKEGKRIAGEISRIIRGYEALYAKQTEVYIHYELMTLKKRLDLPETN